MGIFGLEFEKRIAISEITTFKFGKCKVLYLLKNISLGPKLPLFGYFWTGTWTSFMETVPMFKISTLEFVKMQGFM